MTESEFNRNDPAIAAEIMERLCPSETDRIQILRELLHSVAIAEELAPSSCAVTLFENGFRLNVGPVESLQFVDGMVKWLLLGNVQPELEKLGELSPSDYRSMPQPQYIFRCSVADLERALHFVRPLHAEYVRTAAVTKDGKPRRASYSKYHSPGLITYAERIARFPGRQED